MEQKTIDVTKDVLIPDSTFCIEVKEREEQFMAKLYISPITTPKKNIGHIIEYPWFWLFINDERTFRLNWGWYAAFPLKLGRHELKFYSMAGENLNSMDVDWNVEFGVENVNTGTKYMGESLGITFSEER